MYCNVCHGEHKYAFEVRTCTAAPVTQPQEKSQPVIPVTAQPQPQEKPVPIVPVTQPAQPQPAWDKLLAQVNVKAASARVNERPTEKQINYVHGLVRRLCKKPTMTATEIDVWLADQRLEPTTKDAASDVIEKLIAMQRKQWAQPKPAIPPVPPAQPQSREPKDHRTSFMVVNMLQNGRYAIPVGNGSDHIFVRVARPDTGVRSGKLIVQTQHSEQYNTRLEYRRSDQRLFYEDHSRIHGLELGEVIMRVLNDRDRAAFTYGEKLEKCNVCNRKLTDARSRHYSIGPECEKKRPAYIQWVESWKGPFQG